jgi:hypothetical protein
MEEFFLGSWIVVAWVFSVYLAYHVGRNWEYRANERDLRRKQAALINSPWLSRS